MKSNDRFTALQVLIRVLIDKIQLNHALDEVSASPLAKAISFGVCRYYYALDAVAKSLVAKEPKAKEIWLIILMGLYQIQFFSKPQAVTVQETVHLLDILKKPWAKGLVNAVLRRYCRSQTIPMTQTHPAWLIERLQTDWPDYWNEIAAANDQHPPLTLRVNSQKTTRQAYLQALSAAKTAATALTASSVGLILTEPCDVTQIQGFTQGWVSLQDESAQLAAGLLELEPNLSLLDACSAPGGKLCHVLEAEPHLKACIGLDCDPKRLASVKANITRLGLQNPGLQLIQGNALNPNTWWQGEGFDRILLDAPCSATGVIRRHPDIKVLRTSQDVDKIAAIQAAILQAMWTLLKPNGLLLYATCSLLNQENRDQILQFTKTHPDCLVATQDQPWGINTGYGWQILPGTANRDGFFYSVLRKT